MNFFNKINKTCQTNIIIKNLFLAFFFYQLIQHSFVWLYHDDYGYVSLHYGTNVGTEGLNYGLPNILEYLHWHYMNWGGRVLFFFFLIVLIRLGGLMLIRIVQSIIVTAIMYETYLLVRGRNKDSILLAITTVLLWGSFSAAVARDGVYWFTASVLYTWPMAFLLLGLLILKEYIQIQNKALRGSLLFLLFFIAGFSQEQMAILAITVVVFHGVSDFHQKKPINYVALIGVLTGGAIEILAPGNFVRANGEANATFESLSIIEKIQKNFYPILSMNVGRINILFMLLICCAVMMSCLILWRKCKGKPALIVAIALNFIYPCIAAGNYVFGIGNAAIPFVMTIWVINAAIVLIVYGIIQHEDLIIVLFCAGVCSQAMMVVSPSLSFRSAIIFQYIMLAPILIIFERFCKEFEWKQITKMMFCSAYVLFTLAMLGNGLRIGIGYYRNNIVNKANDAILTEASEQTQRGEIVTQVPIYKLKKDIYGADMPYSEGKNYIEYWIRDYYQLPENVEFVYLDGWKATEYWIPSQNK